MNRVMPPSTGSSYTMSARSSPACGRASGRFSIFTARTGRFGIVPCGAGAPVSGQTGGGVFASPATWSIARCNGGRRVAGEGQGADADAGDGEGSGQGHCELSTACDGHDRDLLEGRRVVEDGEAPSGLRSRADRAVMLTARFGHLNDLGRTGRERHISSRRRIRSAIGGCVENSFSIALVPSPGTREGWSSHRCAVALLAACIAWGAASIFFRAATSPGG